MGQNIQFKRGSAATFHTLNPVLLKGEPAVETDTNKIKIGDGATAWRNLPYANPDLETVDGGQYVPPPVPGDQNNFSPPNLEGLSLWMDATHSGYIHEVGGKVSLWEDMSSERRRFVQSSKASRPAVSAEVEGKDVVTFDGSNDAMISNFPLSDEFTILVAFRRSGLRAGARVISALDSNDENEVVLLGTDAGSSFGASVGGSYSASQPVDDMVPVIYALRSASDGFVTRLNGLNQQSGSSPIAHGLVRLCIGSSRSDFSAGAFSGDVAEVVMYDRVLSDADIADVENYMMERWGVVAVTHPLRDGMKAFWPLNEESGDRLDITAAEVPLTPTGTVGFAPGVIENAAEFTGGNNYLQAPSDFALDGSFAISAWFKAASMAGGRSVLVQNWAAGNASGQVELGFGDDGFDTNAVFGRIATDDDIYTVVVPDLEANLWHHVVLVYSATANTLTLYLNGLQAAQVATLGSFGAGNIPLRVGIGDQTATQNDLACVVDQLGIWDRVLSLQDVQMLYNYELGKEDFTADLYGDNVSLLLHMDKPANAAAGTGGGVGDLYFNDVALLLHFDGADGSTTFTDSGSNALTVTANGNAQISTAQSRFGGASLLFPGNGGNLAVTHDPALDFGNGDFTLEFWYYPLGSGSGRIGGLSCDGGNPWNLYVYSNGNIAWGRNCVGDDLTVPSGLVTNQWQHIAVARSVGVVRIFVDGALKGSDTLTIAYDNFGGLTVGPPPAEFSNFGDTFNGYIDELRITKGVARYTEDFTPPSAPFPDQAGSALIDPDFDKVSLLLKMDGANGSATFTDSGPNALTVTANGNAAISTAQSKWGGASGYFDGNGSYVSIPSGPFCNLAADDFTVEFWYAASNPVNNAAILSFGWAAGYYSPILIYCWNNGDIGLFASSDGASWNVASELVILPAPALGSWHHIAITRSGETIRTFADGGLTQTISVSGALVPPPSNFTVAARSDGTFSTGCYIDDLRITKGVARYTEDFTPPTASFPLGYTKVVTMPSVETSLLLHFDGTDGSTTFTDSGSNARTVTATGGAVISTAQSKFGGASGYFVGTPASGSSKLSIPTDTNFGTDDFTVEAWIWIDENTAAAGWSDGPCIVELGSHSQLGEDGIIFMTGLRSGNWIAWAWCFPAGGPIPETSNSITPGEWTHVAWTRQGNVFRIFIDGIKGTEYTSSASIPASDNSIQIGGSLNGATPNAFGGYIDEVRVIKGQALYTANFTPPTLPHPNPPVSPSLLLHFDGPDGSTTFVDSGSNALTVTAYGSAAISTAQSKFGGSSLLLDIENDWVSLDGSSDFAFGTGDFTIEAWIYVPDNGDHPRWVVSSYDESGSTSPFAKWAFGLNPTTLWFLAESTTRYNWSLVMTCPTPVPRDAWVHVAVARSAGQIRIFLNGVIDYEANSGINLIVGDTVAVGTLFENGSWRHNSFDGYIDEFRIVKGQALYTANFTPPTESFATTSTPAPDLLLHFDGTDGSTTFTDHGKNQLAATAIGYPQIDADGRFNGALDATAGSVSYATTTSQFSFDGDFTIEFWYFLNAGNAQRNSFVNHYTDAGHDAFAILGEADNSGSVLFSETGFGWPAVVGPFSFVENAWTHFAVVRAGDQIVVFSNGVEVGRSTSAITFAGAEKLQIGGNDPWISNYLNAYVDELRIIKGTALYTENFNPPAAPFQNPIITLVPPPGVDPYFNNVFMLFHFDGTDGSDVFTDSSTNALTATPNYDVQISTTESKFGGASLQVVHTPGNYLDVPCDFNLASDSWTLECWVNADVTCCDAAFNILTTNNNQFPDRFVIDFILDNGNIYPRILTENNVVHSTSLYPADNSNLMPIPTDAPYTYGTWAHLAFVNNAETNNFSMYVDGVRVFSRVAIPPMVQREAVQIGRQYDNNFDGFDGTNYYLDDLRLTVGVARYTDNFTPPTAAFPDAAGGGGDGGDGPITTFIDTSKHNHEVTATGSAYLNLEDIKYGNASGEFAGGHCEIAMSPEFAFDDGDFTVEFWGKLSYVQYSAVFSTAATSQEAGTYLIGFSNDTNMFGFCYDMDNFTFVSANIAEYYNTWAHYAFVRLDGVLKMYIDGAEVATANANINLDGGAATTAVIGRRWTDQDNHYLDGLIDDLRITKGVARYIAEFNPPAKALPDPAIPEAPPVAGDPYAEHVTLLLHMDGADGSAVFTDNSYLQNAVTAEGGAVISTEQSKFGGASAYFDGSSRVSFDPELFHFGTGDFTVEAWVKPSTFSNYPAVLGPQVSSANGALFVVFSDAGHLLVGRQPFGWFIDAPVGVSAGQWFHLAITSESGTVRAFVDGVKIGEANQPGDFTLSSSASVGTAEGANDGLIGYIDELRITKGVARYTEDFTPPTVPFPSPFVPGPTAALLLHFDGADGSTTFTDSSVNALAVTANGSAAISTAQSKFGGSSLFMSRGGGGYLSMPYSSALDFGTGDFTVEWWMRLSNTSDTGLFGGATQCGTWSVNCATEVRMAVGCANWDLSSSGWVCPVEQWVHIAVARHSGTLRFFADGVEIASAPNSVSYVLNPADMFTIGTPNSTYTVEGYIDELRVVKGTAVYTANFTPPTAPFSPTADVKPIDVTGCDLWLDSTGDIGEVNGSIVTWADKSGNGRTATPADYAPAPFVAVGEGPKGQNVVRFSGDPNVLDVGYQFNLKNSSGFVVVGRTAEDCSTSRPERILSFQPANGFDWQQNDAMVFHHNQNEAGFGLHSVNLYSNGTYVAHSIGCPMEWTLFSYVIDGAGNVRFRRNGVDEETATFSSLANKAGAELLLGYGGDFTQQSALRGDIAEVVIFDHALGEAALIGLERGLLARCLPPPTLNLFDGLLGYWTLDGNADDFTANNYDMISNGSPSSFDAGKLSGGLLCAGGGYRYGNNAPFNSAGNSYSVTVNLWFKTNATDGTIEGGRPHLISTMPEAWPYLGWDIAWDSSGWPPENPGCLYADVRGASNGLWVSSNNNYTDGQWHMVTLVMNKEANTVELWVDGVKKDEDAYVDAGGQYGDLTIGYREMLGNSPFYGTIDEAGIWNRALTGAEISALYNSGAGLSPIPAGDTVLLLHMDGADGSTTFTDSSVNALTVTANGDAAISTAQSKFGGASVYFDGSGSGLTVEESSAVRLGSADFTIEFWVYNSGTGQHFIGRHISGVGANWLVGIVAGNLYWEPGSAGTGTFSSQPVPSNEWVHIAVTRSSGECKSFINGVLVATGNVSGSLDDSILCPLTVGADSTFTNAMTGYIDELRIVKGAALYTENFTPPIAPFNP